MKRISVLALSLSILLGAALGAFADDAPSTPAKTTSKLTIRKLFEKLSDKARLSLRDMTDECLERVAVIPKSAKIQWCQDQVQMKIASQDQMQRNQENTIKMLTDQQSRCPETALQGPDNGQSKKDRIKQCEDRINNQITMYKTMAENRNAQLAGEMDQCTANPDMVLENGCRVLENAYRNYIDAQLNQYISPNPNNYYSFPGVPMVSTGTSTSPHRPINITR